MKPAHHRNSGAAVDISAARAIADLARHQPAHRALCYAGGDLTNAGLEERAASFAALLTSRGIEEGDRVAYLGLNSTAFFIAMLGAFRIGAVFVTINIRLARPELGAVLDRSGAEIIVCEDGHRGVVDAVRDRTALRRFLLIDDVPVIPVGGVAGPHWSGWSA